MQAAEAKHASGVESLKEGWVLELKRQKEAWTAAEKSRRDTWLADKTKQVKELTVKVGCNFFPSKRLPACLPACVNLTCVQKPSIKVLPVTAELTPVLLVAQSRRPVSRV